MNTKLIMICITTSLIMQSCKNDKSSKQSNTIIEATTAETKIAEPTEAANGKITGDFGGCGYNKIPSENTITLIQQK